MCFSMRVLISPPGVPRVTSVSLSYPQSVLRCLRAILSLCYSVPVRHLAGAMPSTRGSLFAGTCLKLGAGRHMSNNVAFV
jgi:hypothetical protein